MPVITVTLIEGYDKATRQRLGESLTDAARAVIAAPLDGVTVLVNEVAAANYMRGRQCRKPGPPLPAPQEVVKAFLKSVQARDLAAARQFLSDDFVMTFPGDVSFTKLEQLVDWAKTRYRNMAKTYERFDNLATADESVVYCFGTLGGEWPDGSSFSGARFIDRFTLQNGLLTSQLVWNDLAELAKPN